MNSYRKVNSELRSIDQKIAKLIERKNELENFWIKDVGDEISKILSRKRVFMLNKSEILKRFEKLLDQLQDEMFEMKDENTRSKQRTETDKSSVGEFKCKKTEINL